MTPGFKPLKIVICVCKSPEMSMMTGLLQKKRAFVLQEVHEVHV